MTAFVRRTKAIAHKEVLHMIRDTRVLYLALGLPVLMLFLFGYGISTDIDHIPIAVVDHDHSRSSRELVDTLVGGRNFVVAARPGSAEDALPLLRRGRIDAVLVIPPDYQRDLERRMPATAQLLIDGSDGTVGTIALGDAVGAVQVASGRVRLPPVVQRFNPTMRSADMFVPGVIALILAMVSSLLSGLTVAREWERGSMEQLFATPVTRGEIVVGKLIPYAALGLVQTLLIVTLGSWLFDVPIRGSLLLLFGASALFLLAMLGVGLVVSIVTRSQLVSVQAALLVTLLPTTMLSGFMFPIANMPLPLRAISYALPGRYYITILRGVFLKGNGLAVLGKDVAALAVFATAVLALAVVRFRRRLA